MISRPEICHLRLKVGLRPWRLICRSFLTVILAAAPASMSSASVVYTYDSVGRITSALYDNDVCVVYSYDANGNRTSQVINAAGSPNTPTWGTGIFGCFRWSS